MAGLFVRAGTKFQSWIDCRLSRKNPVRPGLPEPGRMPENGPYRTSAIGEIQIRNIFVPGNYSVYIAGGINFEMVGIPAGQFTMGGTVSDNEKPVRKITLSPYGLAKDPTTNAQYKLYLENTAQVVPPEIANLAKANHPVVNVSWHDAVKYCNWLSETTGRKFRLPTEAEWERAARGPEEEGREYPWGNEGYNSQNPQANFDTKGTVAVDDPLNQVTAEGIRGLAGNVWEWCMDWYAGKYDKNDLNDPKGPKDGQTRILRGGSWVSGLHDYLRGAYRYSHHNVSIGFRVAEDFSNQCDSTNL